MSDYAKKNNRNGNDKRYDRNRKQYNNPHYNNPQYMNPQYMNSQYRGMDKQPNKQNHNRKQEDMDNLLFLLEEALPEIKSHLEKMVKNQVRIADAEERKADAEERKANAIEKMARILDEGRLPAPVETAPEIPHEEPKIEEPPKAAKQEKKEAIVEFDRKKIIKLINNMRKKGATYDQIASHLESRNIATFSGKGRWHAQTVHKFCQSTK